MQIKVRTDERPDTGSQRSVFPGSHPSKYQPRSTLLNFSDRATELALVATVRHCQRRGSQWTRLTNRRTIIAFWLFVLTLYALCDMCNVIMLVKTSTIY